MKTTLHTFDNHATIQRRELQLPTPISINGGLYSEVLAIGDTVEIDNEIIYFNQWVNTTHGIVIPDFAILAGTRKGFYLHQSADMLHLREHTYQCGHCKAQYYSVGDLRQRFCTQCLDDEALTEDNLYLLFLRPVITLDIDITAKSIFIPQWLKEKYNERNIPTFGF
jgi:hypothetical protein